MLIKNNLFYFDHCYIDYFLSLKVLHKKLKTENNFIQHLYGMIFVIALLHNGFSAPFNPPGEPLTSSTPNFI